MKHTIFLISLFCINCSSIYKLNYSIDESQRDCLKESPFNTAQAGPAYLNMQLKYRKLYLNEVEKIRSSKSNDTIFLTENYDFICFGCASDYVTILIDTMLYTYKKEIQYKKYEKSVVPLNTRYIDSYGYHYDDLEELSNEIKDNALWYKNPERFGTDNCLDGGHTFYTVIFPSGKIESMYMRCWTHNLKQIK
jgi:hypothetical protein